MINSRKLDDLNAETRDMAEALIAGCLLEGVDLIVTSTYRDNESQAALYAQGRTKPGNKVTRAGPGRSFHNYRVALDVVPVVNGKAVWNDNKLWSRIGDIGESAGLEWGGAWSGFVDKPHFQNTGGRSIDVFSREVQA